MAVAMDEVVHSLRTRMQPVDFDQAAGQLINQLISDVIEEKLQVSAFWHGMLHDLMLVQGQRQIVAMLRDENQRQQIKNYLRSIAPQKIHESARRLLGLRMNDTKIALVNSAEWGINPEAFTETFSYDDRGDTYHSFMQNGDLLVRVYYSLDHTLGAGSEATLHIALLGLARKISEDESLPLKKRYAPLRDLYGNLLVSRHVMVAKRPHDTSADASAKAKVDVRRHQRGSINLRDLTLANFFTQESKKTLPGLWSLPRFADFGEDKRLYYEYIQGVPLQTLLGAKEFDILARLITLKHMAQTLHYMHAMGYIHNDVKPQNVIISDAGIATIIDFGLTEKYLEAYKSLDEAMQKKIVGTPLFMSPEQVTKRSRGDASISEIRYAAPIKSQDELAYLRRTRPEKIIAIDGLEFEIVDAKAPVFKTPFFYDGYYNANFFSDEKGNVVPITGKSDVFSLGVNILYLTTGTCHLANPSDTRAIIQDLNNYNLRLADIQARLPNPLNVTQGHGTQTTSYKEKLEELIRATLEQSPQRRPAARVVAETLREIIVLYFGGDQSFFSTFDDECTYLRNRLYRKKTEKPLAPQPVA